MTTLQQEAEILKEQIDNEGLDKVARHINEKLDQWKSEPVQFAVTGASGSGKSRFINSIRNVKPGDIGFAKPSPLGNTTKTATQYDFPGNPLIKIFDLPGFGTTEQTIEGYETRMNLHNYDYFFIFVKHVEENDITLAKKLKEVKKPFCFVRSKLDVDLGNYEDDGDLQSELIDNIRSKTFDTLKGAEFTDIKHFVISSKDRSIGDFDKLLVHFEDSLSNLKREVVKYSILGILSADIIQRKYLELKKRLLYKSVGTAGVALVPVSGVDFSVNIGILALEIIHYKTTFGFDQEFVKETAALDGVRERIHKNSLIMIANDSDVVVEFVLMELGKCGTLMKIVSTLDPLIPFLGSILSACTAGIGTYIFLNKLLDICKDDAKVVYSYLMDKPVVVNALDSVTMHCDSTRDLGTY